MWEIKDKSGKVIRCTAGALEYNGTWMGECYVTVTIESPNPIAFEIGDYLEYRGERFEINYDPTEIKSAPIGVKRDGFKYEQVKFNSLADELTRCDFLDYVKEDNQIHYTGLPKFSFFAATIQDLADRIQVNLDRLYNTDESHWTVKVQPEYVNKTDVNVSIDQPTKVWGALELVTKNFGAYFVVRGRTITIGTSGIPTNNVFKYGKGNGLATIKRQAETDQQIITRLRVYGSTDNMPLRYYNNLVDDDGKSFIPNNMAVNFLMLPSFPYETQDPYIDSPNIETLGVREGSVFFDGSDSELENIRPSIEGMTAEQLKVAGVSIKATGALDEVLGAEQCTDDGVWEDLAEGEEIPNFTIQVKDLGFDINDHLTTEEAVISMKSGMLGGREFNILKCEKNSEGYLLTCSRVYDDSLRLYFPYNSYNIKAGDKFVLLHIEMPEVYIKAASQRLLEAGRDYLAKNDYSRSSYSPEIDEIFMAKQHVEALASGGTITSLHDTIKEGDIMLFEDVDLLIENASVVIDTLQIKEGDEKVPTYTVTLRNEKTVGTLQRLQNQIDSIVSGGGQGEGGYTALQIRNMVFAYGKERFLSKVDPDKAQKVITFLEGAEFGEYVSGFAGAKIDGHGNAEFESIESRSYLKVMELIYNRLNALEGNTSFADVGTIESVEPISDTRALLHIRKRWDGDFTSFQYGDILYGYVNDLASTGVYYKAWAWVSDIDRTENTITVNYYADTDVPAGHNFPMTANMIVTRWGNILAADANSHRAYPAIVALKNGQYINTRQSSFFISCEDGNIVQLLGVDRPILQPSNYGTILGQIPSGLLSNDVEAMLNPQQPYLYARGIVVQDLIRIGYEGLQTAQLNMRGPWSLETAQSSTDYYRNYFGVYDVVSHNGYMWQCVVTGTTDEPSEETGSWVNLSGFREDPSVNLWQIIPSSNVIIVREKETIPESLTCKVERKGTLGDKTYHTSYSLLEDDLKLYFSLDGLNWREFIIGTDEPIELEDESDVISLEQTSNGEELTLSMGGEDILAKDFGESVFFQLRDAVTDKVITALTVPVVKDGESQYTLDISNEYDAILCDSEGTIVMQSADYPQTIVSYYRGSEKLAISNMSVVIYADGVKTTAIQFSLTTEGKSEVFKLTNIPSMPEKLEVVFTVDGHKATFSINRDNGDCIYNLLPSVSQVKVDKLGNYSVANVSCKVQKTDRSGTSTLSALGSLKLKYLYSNGSLDSMPQQIGYSGGVATANKVSITFLLYDAEDNLLDRETVPVVKDGEDGQPGGKGDPGVPGVPGENGSHEETWYKVIPSDNLYNYVPSTLSQRNFPRDNFFSQTPGDVSTDQMLIMTKGTINGDGSLNGSWSQPVRISGERGAVGPIGERGLMAYPAGVYDIYTTYSSTGTTTPVVLDRDVDTYYVLKGGKTWVGKNQAYTTPHEDYAQLGANSAWTLMEKFNSIFANIIMAQFAKLAQSVHYGDYMFSNYGTRRELITGSDNSQSTKITENVRDQYDKFDESYFDGSDSTKTPNNAPYEPNLLINWLTGYIRAYSADIKGRIESGIDGGKRILIDPETQQLSVFNSKDQEVVTFEGNDYASKEALFGVTGGDINIINSTGSSSEYKTNAAGDVVGVDDSICLNGNQTDTGQIFHSATPTEITFNGYIYCYAQCGHRYIDQQNPDHNNSVEIEVEQYGASITAQLYVYTFEDKECKKFVSSKLVTMTSALAEDNGWRYDEADYSGCFANNNVPIKNKAVRVPAGYHKIYLAWTVNMQGPNARAQVTWGSASNPMSAKYSSDFYVSRIFGNGFCFGMSGENYILGYKDSDNGMCFKFENNGYGLDLTHNRPRIKHGKTLDWVNIPLPVFHGRAYYNTSDGKYYWNTDSIRSCTSTNNVPDAPSLTSTSQGKINIYYPSKWPTINANNVSVNVVGYGPIAKGSNPNKAQIDNINAQCIVVTLSDDESTNDGGFIIDIQLI